MDGALLTVAGAQTHKLVQVPPPTACAFRRCPSRHPGGTSYSPVGVHRRGTCAEAVQRDSTCMPQKAFGTHSTATSRPPCPFGCVPCSSTPSLCKVTFASPPIVLQLAQHKAWVLVANMSTRHVTPLSPEGTAQGAGRVTYHQQQQQHQHQPQTQGAQYPTSWSTSLPSHPPWKRCSTPSPRASTTSPSESPSHPQIYPIPPRPAAPALATTQEAVHHLTLRPRLRLHRPAAAMLCRMQPRSRMRTLAQRPDQCLARIN